MKDGLLKHLLRLVWLMNVYKKTALSQLVFKICWTCACLLSWCSLILLVPASLQDCFDKLQTNLSLAVFAVWEDHENMECRASYFVVAVVVAENEITDSKGPMLEVIESEITESWSLELCTLTLLFCSSLPCRKLLEQAFDQALYELESQVTYQIFLREPF